MSDREHRHKNSTNVRVIVQKAWLGAVVTGLSLLSRVTPALGARVALDLWLRPRRHATPRREADWLEGAEAVDLDGVPAWSWGEGPPVLLVHGWEGRGSQMGGLALALAEEGFRAVAPDLPAHGRSEGRTLDLPRAAATIARVARALSPVAVVAHSFGAAATAYAVSEGTEADRLVLLAPAAPSEVLGRYAAFLGLAPGAAERMADLLTERVGVDPRNLTAAALAGRLWGRGLVVHDPADRVVPFEDGHAYAAHWRGADLLEAPGQGHHRMLRDPGLVRRVVDFVAEPRRERWTA